MCYVFVCILSERACVARWTFHDNGRHFEHYLLPQSKGFTFFFGIFFFFFVFILSFSTTMYTRWLTQMCIIYTAYTRVITTKMIGRRLPKRGPNNNNCRRQSTILHSRGRARAYVCGVCDLVKNASGLYAVVIAPLRTR